MPSPPATAQIRNLYEVTGVRVDETAENAEAAREKAIAVGERRAFELLMERITAPDDRARLGAPPQTAIQALIKDFWISDEKASRVRYIADLNFNFHAAQVRAFLRRNGIAFTTQPAPAAAIIPVFRSGEGVLLWEEANPWRAAWAGETGTTLRPLRVATAGSADRLSAEQALAGDPGALAALAQALDTTEAIVAIADIAQPAQADQALELRLTLNRVDRDGRSDTTPVVLRGRPGEDAASLLKRGVKETALVLDAAWKGQTRITPRPTQVRAVEIPVAGLGEWLEIRRKMTGIDAIEGVNVVLYARDRVRINLVFGSSPEDLANTLRHAGLALSMAPDVWTLRLAVAAPPPPNLPPAPASIRPAGPASEAAGSRQ